MSAPLRIVPKQRIPVSQGDNEENTKFYFEKLLKLIPAEAQSLFALHTIIPAGDGRWTLRLWIAFCFVVVVVVRVLGTSDRATGIPPDWVHVTISCVAFFLWLLSMGMVFPTLHEQSPHIAILLMAAFTFVVPYVYKKP